MTREQQREYVRQQVRDWMTKADIGVVDVDVAVDLLIKHWLRTREFLPPDVEVPLSVWCDTFHDVLMSEDVEVRRAHWRRQQRKHRH